MFNYFNHAILNATILVATFNSASKVASRFTPAAKVVTFPVSHTKFALMYDRSTLWRCAAVKSGFKTQKVT